jgi:hypothetical protein
MSEDIVEQIEKQLGSEDYDMVDLLRMLEDAANQIRLLRGQSQKPTGFSDKVK